MYRSALTYLKDWKNRASRKPLVVRGARQVGKTFLVRQFAKEFEQLIEIDVERDRDEAAMLTEADPVKILKLLELKRNVSIEAGKCLLFIDEIQAAPSIFAKLRYFYEQLPQLHVVAAGSLLEFALEEHEFSMPVGRIEYMHLGPMTFHEFLVGTRRSMLAEFLAAYVAEEALPPSIHAECMSLFKTYLAVGGMPESVARYSEEGSVLASERAKESILSTYVDDFRKYGRGVKHHLVEAAFRALPALVGNRLKYNLISRDARAKDVAQALHMLSLARVTYLVRHSSCSGIPLRATINVKLFKPLFLDVGLVSSATGLRMTEIERIDDMTMVNAGGICEQFVGQHLLYGEEAFREPELYFWAREKKTSNAEVDFVITIGRDIVPVEVKAGKTGTLKSLHLFCNEKNTAVALRFNLDVPSIVQSEGTLPTGDRYRYRLLSLPCYLVGEARRLVSSLLEKE
jgi:predicted AAA+ superfamily ATPase